MLRVIKGKRYNTDTAVCIASEEIGVTVKMYSTGRRYFLMLDGSELPYTVSGEPWIRFVEVDRKEALTIQKKMLSSQLTVRVEESIND